MKTCDMIKELYENPQKRFKCLNTVRYGEIVKMSNDSNIVWNSTTNAECGFSIYTALDWDWSEIKSDRLELLALLEKELNEAGVRQLKDGGKPSGCMIGLARAINIVATHTFSDEKEKKSEKENL